MQQVGEISVTTRGKGLYDITREVAKWTASRTEGIALLTLFCRHTSASLTIQENYDPDVVSDIARFFERLVPETVSYTHLCSGAVLVKELLDLLPGVCWESGERSCVAVVEDEGAIARF